MKAFFSRWWRRCRPTVPADDAGYFATQFVEYDDETRRFVQWDSRAGELGARSYDSGLGVLLLIKLFGQDSALAKLGPTQLAALGGELEYVQVERGRRILGQDEQGDYLLIVLQGAVAEERRLPSGVRVRLGEAQAGDLIGEMSVLEGETRFCSCHALSPVTLAVLSSGTLDRLCNEQPRLAAALTTWLAGRLSLRLRQVSARLSVQLTRAAATS